MKRATVNRRIGVVNGIDGGLAQLGYFTPQVQRVVKKWKGRALEAFIKEYYFRAARAAWWKTNAVELKVYTRAHWPLVWELTAAVERVRLLPKTHPAYWLLRMPINVASNDRVRSITEYAPWGTIAIQIKQSGGPLFDERVLRQSAKRLGLIAPAKVTRHAPSLV